MIQVVVAIISSEVIVPGLQCRVSHLETGYCAPACGAALRSRRTSVLGTKSYEGSYEAAWTRYTVQRELEKFSEIAQTGWWGVCVTEVCARKTRKDFKQILRF